jgi:hypothetical protein
MNESKNLKLKKLRWSIRILFIFSCVLLISLFTLGRIYESESAQDKRNFLKTEFKEAAAQKRTGVFEFLQHRSETGKFVLELFLSPDHLIDTQQEPSLELRKLISGSFLAKSETPPTSMDPCFLDTRVRNGSHIDYYVVGYRLPSADLYMAVVLTDRVSAGIWVVFILFSSLLALWYALFKWEKQVVDTIEDNLKKTQSTLKKTREENATALHDKIKNQLSSMYTMFYLSVDQSIPQQKKSIIKALGIIEHLKRYTRSLVKFNKEIADQSDPDLICDYALELQDIYKGRTAITIDDEWAFRNFSDRRSPMEHGELQGILLEAIVNAITSGNATEIILKVQSPNATSEEVLLIEDNGKGFDMCVDTTTISNWQDIEKDGHYGLGNMRDRARKIGATFDIFSPPPGMTGGCRIQVTIPMSQKTE